MSTEIYNIELPKLSSEQHKNKTFKLISVMNTTIDTETRSYRLLFRDIGSKMYSIEHLPPELLFSFSAGKYYKNSYETNDKPDGEIKEILLSGEELHYRVGKISDFIKDDEYDFDHKIDFGRDIKDFSSEMKGQYCIAYISKGEMVILPSYLIGEKFFFVSTNMRRRIFDSQPERLYEKIEYENDKPTIYLKPGVAFADAPYLVHSHQYQHARDKWQAVRNNLNKEYYARNSQLTHVPLKITPPFKNKIKMQVRYSQLPNNKILVHEIYGHEKFFTFTDIEIVTSGSDGEKTDNPRYSIPKENRGKEKKLTDKRPNSSNTYAGIRNKVEEENLLYQEVNVVHRVEIEKDNPKTPTTTENSNETTDVSSLDPVSGGDEGTSHLNANQEKDLEKQEKKEPNKCKTLFTRQHFEEIYKVLSDEDDVTGLQKHLDQKYPRRIGVTKCNIKETYDKNCANRRSWHQISFFYNKNYLEIIDLDQKGLASGSSVFVMKSLNPISERDIRQLLIDYANNKKIKDIKAKFQSRGIAFIPKKHKCPDVKKHAETWVYNLLNTI